MRVLLALIVAAVAVYALPPFVDDSTRTLLLNRRVFPEQWNMVGGVDGSAKFTFVVGLKQRNLDQLESLFWAVSDPKSPKYRHFMTHDQIMNIVSPPESERLFVKNWLLQNGVTRIVDRKDNFEVHTTVAVVERLFRTKMYTFKHRKEKSTIVRQMGEYSLPSAIWPQYVDIVAGVSDFPPIERNLHVAAPAAGTPAVVPQSLINQYNIPTIANASGASQGVAEFQAGQYFSPTELQDFAAQVNIKIPPLTRNHIIDPIPPVGIEGTLDIQYIAALAPGATNWYWSNSAWLYEWATAVAAASAKPDVFSISYGWSEAAQCEIDDQGCQTLGVDSEGYVLKVNTEFQKIGLQGVSLLSASGDSGANGRTDPDCTAAHLRPDYPGCSPYLTAVGATQFDNPTKPLASNPPACQASSGYSCLWGGEEQAVSYQVSQFTSGGGFSSYATRPSYQSAAVEAYFNSGVQLPPAAMWNRTNRGYPDVASNGHNVLIYSAQLGGLAAVGGTSASSPSFAAYMSLLNHVVRQRTGKPLGFLNPFLYQMYAAQPNTFTDITVGDNICTEDGCAASCQGYYAYKGWDPVTGLGVANVANMLQYVSNHF